MSGIMNMCATVSIFTSSVVCIFIYGYLIFMFVYLFFFLFCFRLDIFISLSFPFLISITFSPLSLFNPFLILCPFDDVFLYFFIFSTLVRNVVHSVFSLFYCVEFPIWVGVISIPSCLFIYLSIYLFLCFHLSFSLFLVNITISYSLLSFFFSSLSHSSR